MRPPQIPAGQGRPAARRGVVAAVFVAIVLTTGTGLGVTAAELLRQREPTETVAAPAPVQRLNDVPAKVSRRPALPPASLVPETRSGVRRPVHCPAPPLAPSAKPATAARAVPRQLAIHTAPDGPVSKTLANPTRDGMVLVVQVLQHQGDWTLVHHPGRPNGSRGWVRAADLSEYQAPHRVVVELCAHRLTVYKAGRVVMQESVAVGAPQWPTPTGRFYVDFQYNFRPTSRGYGPWLLSIAAYSDALHNFGGGIGQIAFHGTSASWSIGRSVSHGCIRLHNDAVTRLQQYALPGTPVIIVP